MRKFFIFLFVVSLLTVSCFALYEQPTGNSYNYTALDGSLGATDFWTALTLSASHDAYYNYHIYDLFVNTQYSVGSGRYLDFPHMVWKYLVDVSVNSDFIQQELQGFLAKDSTYSWYGWIPDVADMSQATYMTSHKYGNRGYAEQTNQQFLVPALYNQYFTIRDNLPLIQSSSASLDSNFSDFYSYFSESSTPVTFRYHYRASPSATLSRSSTTSEVAYLTASSGNRKSVETYTGSNLSFFDRLTLLNNNVVTLGTELLTPNTAYTLRLTDYSADTSIDYNFVSIGDFLHYLGRTVDPLRRLSFVLADDDDIQMKRDTQDQRDYVASLYADGGSAPSATDMSDVNDDISSLNDVFSVGNQNIGDGVTALNNKSQRFWSLEVYNDINIGDVRSGTRSSSDIIDFYSDWISGWSD